MLSPQATPVISATLPAVGGAIGDITPLFYKKMFAAHPELLRDLFNRGNQANGEQQQALAGSIAAFATHLLAHPDTRPDALLSRIAHKHASLGVTAEQYKIVHQHLFEAIVEVLGDAVTPEVAAAWDEVYWLMANALISIEADLYGQARTPYGQVWRELVVTGRQVETPEVTSFTLAAPDGSPLPAFLPGQYVSVQVELPDGAHQIRQYSLSRAPGRPEWRITVKRVMDGPGPEGEVSTWLHANAHEGTRLRVSVPFGDLALAEGDDRPLILASAGIGSTPMLSMLDHLARTNPKRHVTVVHADRAEESHAHRAELQALVAELPNAELHTWYGEPADVTRLSVPAGVSVYLCGPLPFMRMVRGDLLTMGVPAADIHYEVFGPDLWLGQEG